MKKALKIKTSSKEYDVLFQPGGFISYIESIKKKNPSSKITIVTDENIYRFYKKSLDLLCEQNFYLYIIPAGEKTKDVKYKLAIEDFLFKNKNNRQSILLALGGGVVGDLVGYTAATFMRGIGFYMIPTSLLSMVDSSIGGKTGINNKFGKNLIGAFYQPDGILIDINFLKTLEAVQLKNGLAEIIKAGLIKSSNLFNYISRNFAKILQLQTKELTHSILESVKIKGEVVDKDERESGYRRILNFGHTVGHGLELLSNYSMLHGYAISRGMVIEAFFSKEMGFLKEADFIKIVKLIKVVGLDYELDNKISLKKLVGHMILDKKSKEQKIFFNLLNRIGEVAPFSGEYIKEVKTDYFYQTMEKLRELDFNTL